MWWTWTDTTGRFDGMDVMTGKDTGRNRRSASDATAPIDPIRIIPCR
jgi:hypothetical protein